MRCDEVWINEELIHVDINSVFVSVAGMSHSLAAALWDWKLRVVCRQWLREEIWMQQGLQHKIINEKINNKNVQLVCYPNITCFCFLNLNYGNLVSLYRR